MTDYLKRIEQDCYDKLDLIAEVRQLRVRNMELEDILAQHNKDRDDYIEMMHRQLAKFLETLCDPNRKPVTI